MASKKTTGKKSGRSKAKAVTQAIIAPLKSQEAIVPFEPVALPVEVGPMPIQTIAQPNKTDVSISDQTAQHRVPVETAVKDQTTDKQVS